MLADLLAQNQTLADARRNVLAARAQTRAEAWTRHLPPPPADPDRRAAWDAAVLAVAAYRDQYDITTTNPLGPTPDTRDRARTRTWRETTQALHHATRKPTTTTDQAKATTKTTATRVQDHQAATRTPASTGPRL